MHFSVWGTQLEKTIATASPDWQKISCLGHLDQFLCLLWHLGIEITAFCCCSSFTHFLSEQQNVENSHEQVHMYSRHYTVYDLISHQHPIFFYMRWSVILTGQIWCLLTWSYIENISFKVTTMVLCRFLNIWKHLVRQLKSSAWLLIRTLYSPCLNFS